MLGKTGTLGKTLKAIGEDIKEDGDDTGEVRDDGEDIRRMMTLGKTSGRSGKMRKTSRVFPVFASRCHGSHVFPIFLEMSGKSSLPCLCLRCWGRHVFRVSPEMLEKTLGDVGEDIREDGDDMSSLSSLRCWGSHVFPVFLEMSGETCLQYLP